MRLIPFSIWLLQLISLVGSNIDSIGPYYSLDNYEVGFRVQEFRIHKFRSYPYGFARTLHKTWL